MAFIYAGYNTDGSTMPLIRNYQVDTDNTHTAIFKGDVIKIESDGEVVPAAAGDGVGVIGVCVGTYAPAAMHGKIGAPNAYIPANTTTDGYSIDVIVSPHAVYIAENDGTNAIARADIGTNCDHTATAGSTTTGRSGHTLTSGTLSTGGSAQFRILDVVQSPTSVYGTAANQRILVCFNEHNLLIGGDTSSESTNAGYGQ